MKAFNDDPKLLEMPVWLGYFLDYISENHPDADTGFRARLLDAIKLGGDMDAAKHRIQARIQREVVVNPTEFNERVALLHDRAASGDMPSDSEWAAARSATRSAARAAAEDAVEDAARAAAWTAWAAESAAEDAARSATIAQLEQIVLDEVAK